MELRLAVCDDNPADVLYMKNELAQWARANHHAAVIEGFPSAESFLFHYAENKSYDVLLLDIEMAAMDGVALAREIRRDNESVQIIFVTGYSDYIADGYDVSALHYLMKPVHRDKLYETLNRAVVKLGRNERALLLELPGETVRVPLVEIRYLEVIKNYVTVHARESCSVKKPLGEFEKALDDRFYRLGRSYILNLQYISRVTKTDVHLSDGTVLPLPRGQYTPLNRAIISHT